MFAFHKCLSLESALQRYQEWEQDRSNYGVGQVALGFDGCYWLVLVSSDLVGAALPF